MTNFKIPDLPDQPPGEPTKLSTLELASMSPTQKLTVQNERMLEILQRQVDSENAEKKYYRQKCDRLVNVASEVNALKRAKAEMYVSFLLATFLMVVGGALTGSFPVVDNVAPWQHMTGWVLLFLGFVMSLSNRLAVWFICYFFPGILKQPMSDRD